MPINNEPEDMLQRPSNTIDDIDDDNRGNRAETEVAESTQELSSLADHPYQVLTPDVVIDAVESTGRFSDACILALNSYENRVYQVGIEDRDPIIVKFYRPNRWGVEQIIEEHEFTQQLYELEIPVVPPLVINEQSDTPTLARFNEFHFAIYPRQGGRAPQLVNLHHLYRSGQAIVILHAADVSSRSQTCFPFTVTSL